MQDLCNLLGINCVADVVRHGLDIWSYDWVFACRGLVVEGTRG